MTLNGEPIPDFEGTLERFVDLHLDRHLGVAVAVDGLVVPRSEWPSTLLNSASEVEFVTAAAGG